MLRFAKVATPFAAVDCVVVPRRTAPAGPVPIVMATDAPGTRLVKASFTVTATAGEIATPAVADVGCTENTAVAGAAAVMTNGALSAPGVPLTAACSVYVPVFWMLRSPKLATPLAFVERVVVPKSVAAGPVPSDTVTDAFGTRFENASFTVVCTAGLRAMPAVAELGWTVNATVAGAAGLTTAVCGLVNAVFTVSVTFTVCEPAVNSVTPLMKVCEPLSVGAKGKSAGSVAGKRSVEPK